MTLFVPEWLNLFEACYEIKTKFIMRTAVNEAADITSEEGVRTRAALWARLSVCLGLRPVYLLVRQ